MNPLRRVYIAQLSISLGDGAVLSTATLFFAVIRGFGEGVVGPALGGGALGGLLLAVPFGVLADRIGLARMAAILSAVAAVGMVLFATAATPASYIVGAICWGIAQASLLPVRQALAASQVPLDGRVRVRAVLHTLVNVGTATGAAWGAVAVALDRHDIFIGTFVVNAVIYALTGINYLTMHAASTAALVGLPTAESVAWRDRRLLALTGMAALLQLSIAILGVLTPIWVVTRTHAPDWLPAAALVLNMVLVVATQLRWAGWVTTPARARTSVLIGGAAAVLSTLLMGSAAFFGGAGATAAVIGAIVLITVTEVCAGAASWFRLTQLSPVGRQGEFQAVFSTATTLVRIIGPAVLLPLVVAFGMPAWAGIGVLIATAAVLLAIALRRPIVKA